jgi:hypothetical protein
LEGVRAILWSGVTAAGAVERRTRVRPAISERSILSTTLVAIALLTGASPAAASQGQAIVEKCAHGEPFNGYSHSAYREALKHMSTEVREYSPCENLIRKAELAAAGGGTGGGAGTASSKVALPLTPAERQAVQKAHIHATPVEVGKERIRPGVVHADIASAVNTLPHSLFAVLAFLLAGALACALRGVLVAREVRKRVDARRHG